MQLRGRVHEPRPARSLARLAHQPLVRAALVQQRRSTARSCALCPPSALGGSATRASSVGRAWRRSDGSGARVAIVDAMSASDAERWAQMRTFHHSPYSPARIAAARAERGLGVSVCLPARECAQTVGEHVSALMGLREAGRDRRGRRDRRRLGRRDGRDGRARRGGRVPPGRADARARTGARQGRCDVSRAGGVAWRDRLLPGRRHGGRRPRTTRRACSGRSCARRLPMGR